MNPESCSCGSLPAGLRIVRATPDTADVLVELIRELAAFENRSNECLATIDVVQRHLVGPARCAEALLAWQEEAPVGFAVYFRTFSSLASRPGVFLEELYVRERFRRRGIGRALLRDVARLAHMVGAERLEWNTLHRNENARQFYASIGAREVSEGVTLRMDSLALAKFAGPCAGHPGKPVANCGCGGRGPHHRAGVGSCGCS